MYYVEVHGALNFLSVGEGSAAEVVALLYAFPPRQSSALQSLRPDAESMTHAVRGA